MCGVLPSWLRGALLLQALSFVVGDTSHFAEGFAYALRSMPKDAKGGGTGSGTGGGTVAEAEAEATTDAPAQAAEAPAVDDAEAEAEAETEAEREGETPPAQLDTNALSLALAPLFAELAPINPLRPDADGTIDPALYPLLLKGQVGRPSCLPSLPFAPFPPFSPLPYITSLLHASHSSDPHAPVAPPLPPPSSCCTSTACSSQRSLPSSSRRWAHAPSRPNPRLLACSKLLDDSYLEAASALHPWPR